MKRLTENNIKKYLIENYGEVRHNCESIKNACMSTARNYKCSSLDIFYFMIEDRPIERLYTHSYGYNTREGRGIKETFECYYCDFEASRRGFNEYAKL